MPASIKLQQEYGDDIQVIFVESQGATPETAEAFAWQRRWMGTNAMWTTEAPLRVEGNTLPKFALLDTEGRLLLEGNPLGMKKQIEEALAEQVKKKKSPPEGTPAKLAKAWSTFLKGDVAAALAECDKAAEEESLADAARSLRAEMVERTNGRIARARWLLDNGYVSEGEDLLKDLGKAVKGCADFDAAIAKELARVAQPDEALGKEAEASKALAVLVNKMVKGKPFDDGTVKSLKKLAEKHKGTKAAERAEHLAALAEIEFR